MGNRAAHSQPRAHPRSRGENETFTDAASAQRGSSPLTRGKPRAVVRPSLGLGLIPAHAGKTLPREGPRRQGQAHPRSRGENTRSARLPSTSPGSSPLTRGKPDGVASAEVVPGLIPAHAGKTWRSYPSGGTGRAHPRSRGENITPRVEVRLYSGSSPLTRGKPGAHARCGRD